MKIDFSATCSTASGDFAWRSQMSSLGRAFDGREFLAEGERRFPGCRICSSLFCVGTRAIGEALRLRVAPHAATESTTMGGGASPRFQRFLWSRWPIRNDVRFSLANLRPEGTFVNQRAGGSSTLQERSLASSLRWRHAVGSESSPAPEDVVEGLYENGAAARNSPTT